jgi:hypothetical protein
MKITVLGDGRSALNGTLVVCTTSGTRHTSSMHANIREIIERLSTVTDEVFTETGPVNYGVGLALAVGDRPGAAFMLD